MYAHDVQLPSAFSQTGADVGLLPVEHKFRMWVSKSTTDEWLCG
jgi:hypothetical protein